MWNGNLALLQPCCWEMLLVILAFCSSLASFPAEKFSTLNWGENLNKDLFFNTIVQCNKNIAASLDSSNSQFLMTDSGTKIRNGPGFPMWRCKYTSIEMDF